MLENMLIICLFFQLSELKYAYKLYTYNKKSVSIRESLSVIFCNIFGSRKISPIKVDVFGRK